MLDELFSKYYPRSLFIDGKFIIKYKSLAKNLVNLEQFYFGDIKSEIVEPFLEYSVRPTANKIIGLKREYTIN